MQMLRCREFTYELLLKGVAYLLIRVVDTVYVECTILIYVMRTYSSIRLCMRPKSNPAYYVNNNKMTNQSFL